MKTRYRRQIGYGRIQSLRNSTFNLYQLNLSNHAEYRTTDKIITHIQRGTDSVEQIHIACLASCEPHQGA